MPATTLGRRAASRNRPGQRRSVAGTLALAAMVALGCRDTTEPVDTCANIQDIAFDVPVSGTLGAGDCRLLQDNSFVDYWRLVVTSTSNVQIDLASTDFDAYIILNTVAGANINTSDDGGVGVDDARLTVTLSPGTYHILANSFAVDETGAYQLAVVIVP